MKRKNESKFDNLTGEHLPSQLYEKMYDRYTKSKWKISCGKWLKRQNADCKLRGKIRLAGNYRNANYDYSSTF